MPDDQPLYLVLYCGRRSSLPVALAQGRLRGLRPSQLESSLRARRDRDAAFIRVQPVLDGDEDRPLWGSVQVLDFDGIQIAAGAWDLSEPFRAAWILGRFCTRNAIRHRLDFSGRRGTHVLVATADLGLDPGQSAHPSELRHLACSLARAAGAPQPDLSLYRPRSWVRMPCSRWRPIGGGRPEGWLVPFGQADELPDVVERSRHRPRVELPYGAWSDAPTREALFRRPNRPPEVHPPVIGMPAKAWMPIAVVMRRLGIQIDRRGHFRCPGPDHPDLNPSCVLRPARNTWRCWTHPREPIPGQEFAAPRLVAWSLAISYREACDLLRQWAREDGFVGSPDATSPQPDLVNPASARTPE